MYLVVQNVVFFIYDNVVMTTGSPSCLMIRDNDFTPTKTVFNYSNQNQG